MYNFESFEIEGVITHTGKTKIEFTPGIHCVRGGNAVGKSSIFQSLTKLATNELPHMQSKTEKELEGVGRLVFSKDDNRYDIKVDFGKNKYSIIRNDKLVDYRKAKDSREAVADILPWSIDAWQNFFYVSSDTFPILQKGRAAQRRAVFEDLFDIDTSIQKKKVALKLAALNKFHDTVKALEPDDKNIFALKGDKKRISKRIRQLESDLDRYNAELIGAEPAAELWQELCDKYPVLKDIDQVGLEHLIKDVNDASDKLKLIDKFDKLDEADGILAELEAQTKGVKIVDILSDAEANRCEVIVSNKVGIIKVSKADKFSAQDEDRLILVKDALASLESGHIDAKHCPVCKQALKDRTGLMNTYAAEYNDLVAKQSKYSKLDRYISHFESEYGFAIPDPSEIDIAQKKLDKHEVVSKHKAALERIVKIRDFIKRKEAEIVGLERPEEDKWFWQEFFDIGQAAGPLLESRLKYLKNRRDGITRSEKEINDDIHTVKVQLDHARQDLTALDIKIDRWKRWYKAYVKYRIVNLDRRPLELMNDIYSKSLKLAATRHVLAHWLEEMNIAARLAYGEGYEFKAQMDNSGISITCTRTRHGISLTSDVRRLSGYESKMFPLASLLAMAKVLPEDLRTNILILDEIESNMSAPSRRRFVAMLPELQKVYPSIWIITPTNIDEFPITLEDIPVTEYRVEASKESGSHLRVI